MEIKDFKQDFFLFLFINIQKNKNKKVSSRAKKGKLASEGKVAICVFTAV